MDIGSLTGRIELEDLMSSVLESTSAALAEFASVASSNIQVATQFGDTVTDVGMTMATRVTPAILAFGGAAILAGTQVEGAYNTIARKTGETGDTLDGLKKSFDNLFVRVPDSAQAVGAALADVHQRLGLTGTELENVTKKFLDFSNVNQVDVASSTKLVSTLMKALSENTELTKEEIGSASSIMDKLTFAAQNSGSSVTKLAQGVIQGGLALGQLGFDLEESIALFAQFEKVGANTNDVTSSLHRVLTKLAREGVTDLAGAFDGIITKIRGFEDPAKAAAFAADTFGAKFGSKLSEEIRGGTYDIEALTEKIRKVGNITVETAQRSESFTESLGTLRNAVTLALAPIGIDMMDAFRKLIPVITDVVKIGATFLKWISDLPQPLQLAIAGFVGLVAAAGPVLIVVGQLITAVSTFAGPAALGALSTGLTTALTLLPMVTLAIAGLTGAVTFGYNAWKLYAESRERAADAERQAITDTSNLARVNAATGQSFKSMEEASDWMRRTKYLENLRALIPAKTETAKAVDLLKQRMEKLRTDAMQTLSVETRASIEEAYRLTGSYEGTAKVIKDVSEPALKAYIKQIDASDKAAKEAAEAQKKFNEQLKELSGKTAIAGAQEIVKLLGAMNGPLSILPSKLANMAASLREGAQAALHMGQAKLAEQYELLAKSLSPVVQFQQRWNVTIGEYVTSGAVNFTEELSEQVHRLAGEVTTIGPLLVSKMVLPFTQYKEAVEDSGTATERSFTSITTAVKNLGNTILSAVQGGGSILGSIGSSLGAAIGEDLADNLSGFLKKHLPDSIAGAIGNVLPGIGALLGPALSFLGGGLKKLFGIGINEEVKKANVEIQKVRDQLLQTYGSLENLERISQRVGISFVEAWGHQGKEGLWQMTELVTEFEHRLQAVNEATGKMVVGFNSVVEVLGNSSTALVDLGTQGVATFAAVLAATGSYTEALVAVAPAMAKLQQSYIDLGIQVDDVLLKNLMLQSSVLEANPQLVAAIDAQAGAMQGMAQMGLLNVETFSAMQRTAMELYLRLQAETSAAALAAGDLGDQTKNALIPMQSYLQQAAKQAELLGIPLDANTQMLIDQSKELGIWKDAGVTAQDKLIAGMEKIVTKLDEMLSRLLGVSSTLGSLPSPHVVVTTDFVNRHQNVFLPDVHEGGETVYAAGGFMVPQGSDTVPAMLTPGERVLTTQETKAYEDKQKDDKSTAQMTDMLKAILTEIQHGNTTIPIAVRDAVAQTV